ncbi:hypothetical protein ACS0TY_016765 [Phlomoides rotata]
MHELLAPLLYVLHVDVERLSEVRKTYEDHFVDKFDGFSFHENDFSYKFDFKKFSEDPSEFEKRSVKASNVAEVDPLVQTIILLSDAYGAEGELGIILSEKFMEHDAYSMFDALMSGAGGVVAMAEFFSPSPYRSSHTMFPPVIEASAAMYHLLSVVDSSLHSHLVELGVEPQYFSLRWLRVLFGREFSLEDLLAIWDEIFACDNTRSVKAADSDAESSFGVIDSPRGAFISAFAVSMILNLRSSLLATENATACLQRLLNFPDDVKLAKLVSKAKSLQQLAINVNSSNSLLVQSSLYDVRKPVITRGHTLSLDATSPRTPLNVVPESYWEEKWRDLHKEEENKQEEKVPSIRKGWSERVRLRLSRTESDPSPSIKNGRTKRSDPSVRRSLLDDLTHQLGADANEENTGCNEDVEHRDPVEVTEQDVTDKNYSDISSVENKKYSDISSVENSPDFSNTPSPIHGDTDHENESESSSVASNSSVYENDVESCGTNTHCPPSPALLPLKGIQNDDSAAKSATSMKEKRSISGKFQWLFKFGRNANEGTSERVGAPEAAKDSIAESDHNNVAGISTADGCDVSSATSNGETVDQNLMVSLRHLGQSMLENIQVIESVFQQDRDQTGVPENLSKNGYVGKGQVTAVAALKELRKISNLLSEM